MTDLPPLAPGLLARHLHRMRAVALAFLLTVAAAVVVAFLLPRVRYALAPPPVISVAAIAGSVLLAFTAAADAASRLARVKRAYAALGDLDRLLRGHLVVYLLVLLRLEGIVALGLVVARWGNGATASLPCFILAALATVSSWPSADKTLLLVRRAAELRNGPSQ